MDSKGKILVFSIAISLTLFASLNLFSSSNVNEDIRVKRSPAEPEHDYELSLAEVAIE